MIWSNMKRLVLILVLGTGGVAIAALPAWGPLVSPYLSLTPILASLQAVRASFEPSLGGLAGARQTARTPAYRTAAVERGDIVTTVRAAGTLNALVVVEVGSQISGLVKELYADFNSTVTKGQVIARVEPETYEARVATAQADLDMAETMVPVQQAQIERASAQLENVMAAHASAKAETMRVQVALDDVVQNLERKRPLARRNVIADGEWERIQNAHRSAQAQLTASRATELSQAAAVRAAEAARKMARAELANTLARVKQKEAVLRQARIDLDRTYIRAPVTGTVVDRAVNSGQTVAASLQAPVLFTIAQDLTRMQVEASVVEADISRFAVGQIVTFTVDAYPGRFFSGSVQQIRKAPKVVQNVVTYIVVITAENPDEVLLPGMTANLQVVVAKRAGVLKVANAALRYRPPGDAVEDGRNKSPAVDSEAQGAPGRVFVLGPGGEIAPVPLRLGITDGQMTEVLAGNLTEGQLAVTGRAAEPGTATDASSIQVKFRLR